MKSVERVGKYVTPQVERVQGSGFRKEAVARA
jgi:hypothetical protein